MGLINLLPNTPKKVKQARAAGKLKKEPKAEKEKPAGPQRKTFGISLPQIKIDLSFLVPFLIIIGTATALFGGGTAYFWTVVNGKERQLAAIRKQVENIKLAYKKIDELNKKKKELNEVMASYDAAAKETMKWSEKAILIHKLMPPQIWLTSISSESSGAAKALVVRGSATSLIEADIISSITQFVTNLKENQMFFNDFDDIKLGALQSNKKGNISYMSFSLYCKFKAS